MDIWGPQLLPDHDGAAHRRAVYSAIVRVATWRGERDRIGLSITRLDGAAGETGRALRPHAVRDRSRTGPGPRDRAAHRDAVDRGVLAPVVGALEQDVPDDDLAGRTPAPTPAATTTAVRGRRAARERSQREQTDYCSSDTHLILLGHSLTKGTASITGATLAIAPRWLYQTRRLRRARNSGTDLSDDGLHCVRQSARAGRHSGPDRRWWRPPSARECARGRCSPSWPRGPARSRSARW